MPFKVKLVDGPLLEVPDVLPVDIVKFERRFNVSADAFNTDPRFEWSLFVAHCALQRTMNGQIPQDFDAFLERLETAEGELESGKGEEPAGSVASSPASPVQPE